MGTFSFSSPSCQELPLHDVEPVFWVIVLFFIRASPSNAKDEKQETSRDESFHSDAFCMLSSNCIGKGDGRRLLLQYSEGDWKRALHPALHSFVPMLSAMASYFQNTWHFISTTVGSRCIHGHEAMRRILWNTIKDMNMNIPIDNKPVQVTIPANPSLFMMNMPTSTGNKRKINMSEDIAPEDNMGTPPSGKGKRQRVESSSPFEHLLARDEELSQLLWKIRQSHRDGKEWLHSADVEYIHLNLC